MPKKKKPATKTTKKVVKKTVAVKVVKKVAKKATKKVALPRPAPSKTVAPKAITKPAVSKPADTKPAPLPKPEITLGRPLVTQEEKLYMLFHDDYQSRQVFEFLRVETIKELEEFTPQQIVHLMSRPIRLTVDRIRQRLAQFKRSLKDDEQYATEFRQSKPSN